MKTNIYIIKIFFAAAFAALALSCAADEPVNPQKRTPGEGDVSKYYSFSVSAGQEQDAATRASLDMDTYVYSWTNGDKVGLTVTPSGSSTVTAFNLPLTKEGTATEEHANFSGYLTKTQFDALSSYDTFDYYSYYPYNSGAANFPNIRFTTPSTYSATPNKFVAPANAPMVAKLTSQPSVVYLDDGTLAHGDPLIHFEYKHIMSYAAIEMDVRLHENIKVYAITMTANDDTMLWGTYTYDMSTGTGSYSGGSKVLTISIPGGLTVGEGDLIYVPMPAKNISGFTFTFDTHSTTQEYYAINTTTNPNFKTKGVNFQPGQIHKIRLAPAASYTYADNMAGVNIRISQSGYYFIEAWGGNGGNKQTGSGAIVATGGASNNISGLYSLTAGEWITMYIGSAGTNASISRTGSAAGGRNGSSYGNGGAGGLYNTGNPNDSERGSGGGAATFVFRSPTSTFSFPGNILMVSGGGGGSGGASNGLYGSAAASNGGAGASMDRIANNGGLGMNGSDGGTTDSRGRGGGGNGSAGARGSGNVNGNAGTAGSNTTGNGGNGGNGAGGGILYSAGAGGGGGGGGWSVGGGGGGGGATRGSVFGSNNIPGAGGGGGGGQSYLSGTVATPSGYTLIIHPRVDPGNNIPINGYVFITYLRPL